MIPNTNLHKIIGFVSGILVSLLAKKGLDLDPEWVSSILVGVTLVVSSLVAKKTNPTGANTSVARKTLEAVVESKN